MTKDRIDNWHGKPIGDLSRGELIDALDWCVKELRRYQQGENRQVAVPDMLAALHAAVNWYTPPNDSGPFPLKQIAAAIAKAETTG